MCPSPVPPQPFLPSPGQDPQGWFVLVFALAGGVWIIYAARVLLRGLARYVGMTALVLGFVLAIGGLIIHMIDHATYFAVYNWGLRRYAARPLHA
jgi:hypothetical protein